MALRLIEISCARFRNEISDEDDKAIRATSLEDVRVAIGQIENQLAARQSLRNLNRLTPYLKAVERYSNAVDPLCNGVPFLPYIWAPVKFILLAIYEHTQTLEKLLSAYAHIGNSLPWLSRLSDSFPDDRHFQELFGFLYEDILEFHRKAYTLIRKPAWRIFFSSAWGRFERRFGDLIESITRVSTLIDREATSLEIQRANEWRENALGRSAVLEKQRESDQAQALMRWLEVSNLDQELKFEWLRDRCCRGTGSWIIQNKSFRSWLQKGRGNPVMWMFGKPGSGKSVLASQIISFLRSKKDTQVLFFFCDYHSTPYGISARIYKAFIIQILEIAPETIPFFYDEYLSTGRRPSGSILKAALTRVLAEFSDVRLLVDGIDELPVTEHKALIKELVQLSKTSNSSCKLLISSQDIPTIRPTLSQRCVLFLGDEKNAIEKDVELIIKDSLEDFDEKVGVTLDAALMDELRDKILKKSEGMLLWVRLVLSLLGSSASQSELRSNIDSIPTDLEKLYDKILNNILDRCSPSNGARVRRIFEWLIFSEGGNIMKYEVLIGTSLHKGTDVLDRDNRPFSNALEICKPLIEDGPKGTISIIHSTVTQYLLEKSSGPFISSLVAHQDIAFACISQLIQILDYVQDDTPHQDMITRTGLGLLGLQSYANEHWIEHFLRTFTNPTAPPSEMQNCVVEQAMRLCTKHCSLISHHTTSSPHFNEDATVNVDPRLAILDSVPDIQRLVCQVLNFRKRTEDQQSKNRLAVDPLELDATLLSQAHANYQRDIQHLSQVNSHPGLSQEELLAFHSDYRCYAFTCPIRVCERFRFGYDSAARLQEHKQSRHIKALKCYQDRCAYNDVGYPSQRSLRRHQNMRHGQGGLRRIPASIRKPLSNSQSGYGFTPPGQQTSIADTITRDRGIDPKNVTAEKGPIVPNADAIEHDRYYATQQMLAANGINPNNLNQQQFQNFVNAPRPAQEKAILNYKNILESKK